IHKFRKRTRLPISSYIFPLGDSIPLPEVFNILNFQLLALCKKHRPAIIFLVKFFNKLGGYPVSCPAPVNSKCRSAHIAAYCCMNDKISASKGFSMLTVKSYRENDAVGRMIISKKEILITLFERVSATFNHLIGILKGVAISLLVGIDFRVQVQFSQEGPGSSLVGAAVFVLSGSWKLTFDGQQFAFNIGEYRIAGSRPGIIHSDPVFFGNEGNTATIQIKGMPIAKGPEESSFSIIVLHSGVFVVFCITNKLISQGYFIKDAAVHSHNEIVGSPPGLIVEVGEARISPRYYGFIGRNFLGYPKLTNVA